MKNIILASILGFLAATTSFAQDICNANLSNDDLLGTYNIAFGPGTLTIITRKGDRRVHDATLMEEVTATIAIYDGVPILYSDDLVIGGILEISFRLAENDEKDLSFLDDTTIPTMSSDDAALVLNCENAADLPQLIGTGTLTGNGAVLPVSVNLIVYLQDDGGISAIGVYGPVAELCRSFNRVLCAKGERQSFGDR